MPTTNPRIFLTMSPETLAKVDRLTEKLGLTRPEVLRLAVKQMAKRELPPA
jgi:predicted transcriptional regulator